MCQSGMMGTCVCVPALAHLYPRIPTGGVTGRTKGNWMYPNCKTRMVANDEEGLVTPVV